MTTLATLLLFHPQVRSYDTVPDSGDESGENDADDNLGSGTLEPAFVTTVETRCYATPRVKVRHRSPAHNYTMRVGAAAGPKGVAWGTGHAYHNIVNRRVAQTWVAN